MRAYFFGNMYLSSIQQGIQAAHVVAEMALRYGEGKDDIEHQFLDWAGNHKTMVLLNGGYGEELHDLVSMFSEAENPYPWSYFHESEEALDGALTSVGIILPEKIYELSKHIRDPDEFKIVEHQVVNSAAFVDPITCERRRYSKWEWELVQRLNRYGLAR